jgi:hypothetical protein
MIPACQPTPPPMLSASKYQRNPMRQVKDDGERQIVRHDQKAKTRGQ